MKVFIITFILIGLLSVSSKGQDNNAAIVQTSSDYFNNYQKYSDTNPDSAMYFVRLLAAEPDQYLFQELLHNSLAQKFLHMPDTIMRQLDSNQKKQYQQSVAIGYKLLDRMMADSNKQLQKSIQPMYLWVKVTQNLNDNKELLKLTNNFIATQLDGRDMYPNRSARYALLIYQLIAKNKALKKVSDQLFATTYALLKANQLNNDSLYSRDQVLKRTWFRYLYAYSNDVMANDYLFENNITEAGNYFKTAFEYSADVLDRTHAQGYFYDMYFLFLKEKLNFKDDYVNFLIAHNGDKTVIVNTLMDMAIANPAAKEKLSGFYNTHFANGEAFNSFWLKGINNAATAITDFTFQQTDGNYFSTIMSKGKWILVDFWGTWCDPCREEHPGLEKFYQRYAGKDSSKIVLITIACHDEDGSVNSYMDHNKYTFPVALADDKIEQAYNITSYPSKLLITPQGKYIIIPLGVDWADFVKQYADL